MNIRKVLSLFAISAFLLTSCSSDDNSPIRPEQKDQIEVGKESPIVGEYSFNHAGNPIPFIFEKNIITMKMSGMAGSGQGDDVYNVLTTYKNTDGVLKTVAKNKETSEYKAFFFRDIKDDKSKFMFNMDLTAKSEIEAIKAAYPAKDIVVDHGKGQFGWLEMNQGTIVEPIVLPVNGKYVFSQSGHTYYYNFTNEVVNFNGAYDMTVLAHNKNTNKILLQGKDEKVKNSFYVIQLKNIKDDNVDIARLTFSTATAKADAEKEFASQEEIKATFTTYTKNEETNNITLPVNGKYVFSQSGMSYYYNFTNTVVNFNGSYDMIVIDFNKENNKILLQGKGDKQKTYYVTQLKDITDKSVYIARNTYQDEKAFEDAKKEFTNKQLLDTKFEYIKQTTK